MINRTGKVRQYKSQGVPGPELESHFILRLLEPQAKILREDIRQGQTNIKDRLFIQLDHTNERDDMRNGIITFDTIMYKAKLFDLPTIMESWKSIDKKNFYKTADVCQMVMVVENEDPPEEEDTKKKKKDPHKVDKKYLWPHGYTPPLKNVRKRRFRKTLKKKVSNLENLDLAEIEKEVKRLLRTDNEATNVRWDVVREEDEKKNAEGTTLNSNLDKQQLFGEMSSSEDEVGVSMNMDEDDDSRFSVDDSHSFMNENANSLSSKTLAGLPSSEPVVTEFSSSMFLESPPKSHNLPVSPQKGSSPGSNKARGKRTPTQKKTRFLDDANSNPFSINKLYARLSHLESEMTRLLSQRAAQEQEIATIENLALKQKFLARLTELTNQINEKENELHEVRSLLP